MPLLKAIQNVIDEREDYWPLSVRQIHYALLNNPPLIHAGKSDSVYHNVQKCYKALDDLLVRARLEGHIPFEVIADETRPVVEFNCHRDCQSFIRRELDIFLKGYWRDLMQSQPNHVEILAEKNTIAPILRPIAEEYCIPMTTGRGYCSLPPRFEIAKRFRVRRRSSATPSSARRQPLKNAWPTCGRPLVASSAPRTARPRAHYRRSCGR
jgi:hypothetical protein